MVHIYIYLESGELCRQGPVSEIWFDNNEIQMDLKEEFCFLSECQQSL